MTYGSSDVGHPQTQPHVVGSLSIDAPFGAPRHTRGSYGEMWQWIGDGHKMFSVIVASRREEEDESMMGVRGRLAADVARIGSANDQDFDSSAVRQQVAYVPGAQTAFMSIVDGVRDGVGVHNLILIATSQTHTHMTHIAAPDNNEGRNQAAALSASLRVLR